jgi:hypothetical protein
LDTIQNNSFSITDQTMIDRILSFLDDGTSPCSTLARSAASVAAAAATSLKDNGRITGTPSPLPSSRVVSGTTTKSPVSVDLIGDHDSSYSCPSLSHLSSSSSSSSSSSATTTDSTSRKDSDRPGNDNITDWIATEDDKTQTLPPSSITNLHNDKDDDDAPFNADYSFSILLPQKNNRLHPINELLVHSNSDDECEDDDDHGVETEDDIGVTDKDSDEDMKRQDGNLCSIVHHMIYSNNKISRTTSVKDGTDKNLNQDTPPNANIGSNAKDRIKGNASTKEIGELLRLSNAESAQATPTIKTRSVSFYHRVRIHRIPQRDHLSQEEIDSTWYSCYDFQRFRQDCCDTISWMMKLDVIGMYDDERETDQDGDVGGLEYRPNRRPSSPSSSTIPSIFYDDDGIEYCWRGLELRYDGRQHARQKRKKKVRSVVFAEQDFHDVTGLESDPIWLAALVQQQSKTCVRLALEAAELDAEEACLIHLRGHE